MKEITFIGLENELPGSVEEWMQLAPVGEFPHEMGIQRITHADCVLMANDFNSMVARVGRLIGRNSGVPIYVGHPDKDRIKYPDGSAKGWAKKMEARPEGLFMQADMNADGKGLVESKSYRFLSPYLRAVKIGSEKGRTVYKPVGVVSAGLTNAPNLPVEALANEQEEPMNKELLKLLGLEEGATPEAAASRIQVLMENEAKLKKEAETLLANERTGHATALQGVESKAAADLKLALKQRNDAVLAGAIAAARINQAERGDFEVKLANDFAGTTAELFSRKAKLKTESELSDAGGRRTSAVPDQSRREKLVGLVNEYYDEHPGATAEEAVAAVEKKYPNLKAPAPEAADA